MSMRSDRDEASRASIFAALQRHNGNVTHAAIDLGMSRRGLTAAMTRLGVNRSAHLVSKKVRTENKSAQLEAEETDLGDFLSWHDK